jgi:hypothetical protein
MGDEVGRASIRAYPNPATDFIYLMGLSDRLASVQIFNSTGQLMMKTVGYHAGDAIDVRALNPGFYLINTQERSNYVIKLIKK